MDAISSAQSIEHRQVWNSNCIHEPNKWSFVGQKGKEEKWGRNCVQSNEMNSFVCSLSVILQTAEEEEEEDEEKSKKFIHSFCWRVHISAPTFSWILCNKFYFIGDECHKNEINMKMMRNILISLTKGQVNCQRKKWKTFFFFIHRNVHKKELK